MSHGLRCAAFAPKCGDHNTGKDHMAESTIWWLLTGVAVGIELVTGTFYLLMVGVGLAAAALSAHAGMSFTVQMVIAALVGAGAVLAWRAYRQAQPKDVSANANRDVNLDIGETVHVENWSPDGTASVRYRGAKWAVACVSGETLQAGPHRVVEVVGSRLIVQKL